MEFETALFYYNEHLRQGCGQCKGPKRATSTFMYLSQSIGVEKSIENNSSQGKTLTISGPAPFQGNILDDPELLWTEDHWDTLKEEAAKERLKEQTQTSIPINSYWKQRYTSPAGASQFWHRFYQRNKDNFYKDRHYIHVIYPELFQATESYVFLLECGSGVGNAIWPLLEQSSKLVVIAIDFAKTAIDILNSRAVTYNYISIPALSNPYRDEAPVMPRVKGFVVNLVTDLLPVRSNSLNFALCMFVLSAIPPDSHKIALMKIFDALKPGGKVLVRDYGRYDEAQLRFGKGSKLDENFYVRQDGTCSFFFLLEELVKLGQDIGFICEEQNNICRQYANRQQKKARYRVWIHVKFVKPL